MTTPLKTLENEERVVERLGMLLRNDEPEDATWLRQAQKDLLARLSIQGSRGRAEQWAKGHAVFSDGESGPSALPQRWRRNFRGAQGWAIAAAICALLLFALTSSLSMRSSAITFTVQGDGGAKSASRNVGRVRSPANEDRTLLFSDGSILRLEKGGSVRVRETDEHGALVVIEHGTLESNIKHLAGASWSVFAGPYEIEVTGTRFSTEWDPKLQRLVVLLNDGSVQVVGADIENHVGLKPGQRLEASPRESWRVTAQEPSEPNFILEKPAAQQVEALEAARPPVEPKSPTVQPSSDWPELLSHGKFTEIVEEARSQGLEGCYETCSVARLRALADAARYTGEVGMAKEALLRLRGRSPSESARAGYLLGSLSEARGQSAGALAFYDGYLKESPSGALAAEALAGKMRALHTLGRKIDAERAANEYLRLYPGGTSAATARKILNKK